MKIGNFTKAQWIVLNWTARFSATLSLTGSVIIIYMIIRRRKIRLALVHNRLVMGMSIFDIMGSIGYLAGSAAAPREIADQVYGAIGSDDTCTAQGALISLSTALPPYNAMLSIYYLLVIRYECRDDVVKVYEKYMHLLVWTITIWAVTSGIVFGLFSNSGGIYCFIVPFGPDNDKDTIKIGLLLIKIANGLMALWLCIIFFCMLGVYCKVKQQASTMDQYPSIRSNNVGDTRAAAAAGGNGNQNGNNTRQYDDTRTQASLYVSAYIVTYLPTFIGVALGDSSIFVLSLFISITLPLQGFWNMFNFIRPKFIAIRQKNLSKSFSWVLKASVFSSLEEEEQKKRLAARRNTFTSTQRTTRLLAYSSHKSGTNATAAPLSQNTERLSSSLHIDTQPEDSSSSLDKKNNNNSGETNRRYSESDGLNFVEEGDDTTNKTTTLEHQQQQHPNDDNNKLSSTNMTNTFTQLSPLSLTTLLAHDTLLDRTMFMDDTKHSKNDVPPRGGQQKRRHSLPDAFFGA